MKKTLAVLLGISIFIFTGSAFGKNEKAKLGPCVKQCVQRFNPGLADSGAEEFLITDFNMQECVDACNANPEPPPGECYIWEDDCCIPDYADLDPDCGELPPEANCDKPEQCLSDICEIPEGQAVGVCQDKTTFSLSDLMGPWVIHTLRTGDSYQHPWNLWEVGYITFDEQGTPTTFYTYNSTGYESTVPPQSTLAVSPNGVITIAENPTWLGNFSLDKEMVVWSSTSMPHDGLDEEGYGLTIMMKLHTGFTESDLAGDWFFQSLVAGDSPQWYGWYRSSSVIDSMGNVMSISFINSNGDTNSGGVTYDMDISPDGIISVAAVPSWHGVLSNDRNTIVITTTDSLGGYALHIGQRVSEIFDPIDMEGFWSYHLLATGDAASGEVNGWNHGSMYFDSTAFVSFSEQAWTDPTLNFPDTQLNVSGDGNLALPGEPSFHGQVSIGRNMTIMTSGGPGINKWLMVGLRYPGVEDSSAKGTLDPNFGTNGVARYDGGGEDRGWSVALQDDGKAIVTGLSFSGAYRDLILLRYDTDGTLDTSFGTGGVARYDGGDDDVGRSVAFQSDGKSLVTGWSDKMTPGTDDDLLLLRYNIDGTLDTTFGVGGVVRYDNGNQDWGHDVVTQPDNKIIVVGHSDNGTDRDLILLRYNANGSLDTSFGSGGVARYDGGNFDEGQSVILQADGKALVCGGSRTGTDENLEDIVLLRFNIDGTLDTTFGTGGVVRYDGGGYDSGWSVAIQPDDKVLVAGDTTNGTEYDLVLLRYNSNGTLDTTFGTGGVATYNGGGNWDFGNSVVLQPDGKVLVSGNSHNGTNADLVLLRYNTNGMLDTSFGTGGVVRYDNGNIDSGLSVALQSDGKAIVAGWSENETDFDIVIVRFE